MRGRRRGEGGEEEVRGRKSGGEGEQDEREDEEERGKNEQKVEMLGEGDKE